MMMVEKNKAIPNTFGLNVKTTTWLEYDSEETLKNMISKHLLNPPYLHVGAGSNLLFLGDYQGIILHSAIQGVELVREDEHHVWLRVGSGVVWDDFVDYCVSHNYYGVENLSWIPGEVGAAAVQNIGAYGAEVKDLISKVETVNDCGEQRIYPVADCQYAYRNSLFKHPDMKSIFVTRVVFKLSKDVHFLLDYGTIRQELDKYDNIDLQTVRKVVIQIRQTKLPDPAILGNAGSFFMNPIIPSEQFDRLLKLYPAMPHYPIGDRQVKILAGWMIEQCGWKGKSLGPAAVHSRQALVLVNNGGAVGTDIVALSDAVRASVYAKFGIEIHPEVNFIK